MPIACFTEGTLGLRAESSRFVVTPDQETAHALTDDTEVFNVFNTTNYSAYRAIESELGYSEPIGDFPRRQGEIGCHYRF